MTLCVGPIGGQPCGNDAPAREPGTKGRPRIRCDECQGKKVKPGPIDPTLTVAPKQRIHCTWLDHDGSFCNAPLEDDELFCDHHGMPPRAQYVPTSVFTGPGVIVPDAEPNSPGPLETAHLSALTAVGRQESPDGQLVLMLARRLDGGVADSAVANLSAQLRAAAKEVYAGAPPLPGAIDELKRRRQEKIDALNTETEVSDA
jgi:hypothetical protein